MTYESLWNECMLMAGSTGAGDLNGFDISVTDFTSAEMGRVIQALYLLSRRGVGVVCGTNVVADIHNIPKSPA